MKKIKHPYNRLIKISDDHQQITLSDSRFYKRNGKYYPSITYVLKYYPKGQHFEDWLKKVGYSSEHIMKKAGEEGTMVHDLIEMYLNGEEIKLLNNNGVPLYNLDVWRMFINFVEFWETYKPKLIETEIFLFSDELEVAGTCDLICEIDGKLWFLAKEVCDFLEFSNVSRTVKEYCREWHYQEWHFGTDGRSALYLTLAGVVRLCLRSKNLNAIDFQDWVTDDVLPDLIMNRVYIAPEATKEDIIKAAQERGIELALERR